jgi:hypothetical protein
MGTERVLTFGVCRKQVPATMRKTEMKLAAKTTRVVGSRCRTAPLRELFVPVQPVDHARRMPGGTG